MTSQLTSVPTSASRLALGIAWTASAATAITHERNPTLQQHSGHQLRTKTKPPTNRSCPSRPPAEARASDARLPASTNQPSLCNMAAPQMRDKDNPGPLPATLQA